MRVRVGSVVQINDAQHRGWHGAFVLVTELKSWGIQGSVHVVETHETASFAYIRLTWAQFAYIGEAALITDRVQA